MAHGRPAMRKRALSALLGLVVTAAGVEAQVEHRTIAFTNVDVIPMDRDGVLGNQTVVVVGGVISEVGAAGDVSIGSGAMVVDGSGRYLMPGLSEMHAHVPPSVSPPRQEVEDILFFLYIANGITTIRGMLGSEYQIPLAEEIEANEVLGPNF